MTSSFFRRSFIKCKRGSLYEKRNFLEKLPLTKMIALPNRCWLKMFVKGNSKTYFTNFKTYFIIYKIYRQFFPL